MICIMNQDLDDKLCGEFPNLYRDRHASMQVTCMCWGFNIDDGWFDLVYDLSVNIEKLILELPEQARADCKCSQVKEKFGGLRFNMDGATDDMYELIRAAEALSYHICETCGDQGGLRKGGWMKTLCNAHANGKELATPPKVLTFEEIKAAVNASHNDAAFVKGDKE